METKFREASQTIFLTLNGGFEPNILTVNCRMLIQPKKGVWKGRFVAMGYAQDMSGHRETNS